MKINAPQYPMQTSFEPQSPNNSKDCFRTVNPKIYSRIGLKQGELLEDSDYLVFINKDNIIYQWKGKSVMWWLVEELKITYIPWVLARCTIIPI